MNKKEQESLDRTVEEMKASVEHYQKEITEVIKQEPPEFIKACESKSADLLLMTQGAFGHSGTEVFLLGCAIKYAGMHGKEVRIII